MQGRHAFDYTEFLANFSGMFHTLDADEQDICLQPAPVPQCYRAPQELAIKLLFEGSNGIVYPSVRRLAGMCIACFRPALVFHPRRGQLYRIHIDAAVEAIDFTTISSTH
jgi:hypothetical protein